MSARHAPSGAHLLRCGEGFFSRATFHDFAITSVFMPRMSEFYGIAVYMNYRDHLPPHFHAIYGDFEAEIDIDSATILVGKLPRKARGLVEEWAATHREQLLRNWELARTGQPLEPIAPLE